LHIAPLSRAFEDKAGHAVLTKIFSEHSFSSKPFALQYSVPRKVQMLLGNPMKQQALLIRLKEELNKKNYYELFSSS